MVACWTQKEVSGKAGVRRTVTQAGLLAALKPGLLHSLIQAVCPVATGGREVNREEVVSLGLWSKSCDV